MTTYLAFLRAVNVGGTGKLPMADLRAWLETLGFADVRTLLQSGNAIFRGKAQSTEKLEALLKTEAEKRLGLKTDFFVRTADEWSDALACNPFPLEAKKDPAHLLLIPLKNVPSAEAMKRLQAAIKGRERAQAHGREIYVVYPDGIGESKLTIKVIEKALDTLGTGRNWNTALKIAALAQE